MHRHRAGGRRDSSLLHLTDGVTCAGNTAVTLSEDGGHVVLTELGDHPHEAHLHGLTLNKYVEGETVIEGDATYAARRRYLKPARLWSRD